MSAQPVYQRYSQYTSLSPIHPPNPHFHRTSRLSQAPGPGPAPTPAEKYFEETGEQ